mmetsp:Transcript_18479/g.55167  ORF Transcript_18479/g.55167 Transcript_18479/m.55167 type:complete len:291 (-) Transcript_18479:741-1613(-)
MHAWLAKFQGKSIAFRFRMLVPAARRRCWDGCGRRQWLKRRPDSSHNRCSRSSGAPARNGTGRGVLCRAASGGAAATFAVAARPEINLCAASSRRCVPEQQLRKLLGWGALRLAQCAVVATAASVCRCGQGRPHSRQARDFSWLRCEQGPSLQRRVPVAAEGRRRRQCCCATAGRVRAWRNVRSAGSVRACLLLACLLLPREQMARERGQLLVARLAGRQLLARDRQLPRQRLHRALLRCERLRQLRLFLLRVLQRALRSLQLLVQVLEQLFVRLARLLERRLAVVQLSL